MPRYEADQEMQVFLKSFLEYRLVFYSWLLKAIANRHSVHVHRCEIKWSICINSTVDISLIKAESYHSSLFSFVLKEGMDTQA